MNHYKGWLGWYIDWIEEWSQFFSACNWYTFHPIYIEFEDDRMMGAVEATLIVLGVGCRVRWNHTITEKAADILGSVEEIKRLHPDPLQ